jgi:hypothetical protein
MEELKKMSLKYDIIPYYNNEEDIAFKILQIRGKKLTNNDANILQGIITKDRLKNTYINKHRSIDTCYEELFDRVRFNRPP